MKQGVQLLSLDEDGDTVYSILDHSGTVSYSVIDLSPSPTHRNWQYSVFISMGLRGLDRLTPT
ncbi:MAG: hypothetical protein IPH49_14820 [Ignavibacteria bacterium]|nr:hypothetical protein [Ignavibacteria bacterium]